MDINKSLPAIGGAVNIPCSLACASMSFTMRVLMFAHDERLAFVVCGVNVVVISIDPRKGVEPVFRIKVRCVVAKRRVRI